MQRRRGHSKLFSVLIVSLWLGTAATCALAAEYSLSPNLKVNASRLGGIIGKKITASGGATLKTAEIDLKADTISLFYDNQGKEITRLVATDKLSFTLIQKGEAGAKTTIDGTGDSLEYEIASGTATVKSTAGRKSHIHAVQIIPATDAAAKDSTRTYDITAHNVTFDLAKESFEASGEVEMEAVFPPSDEKGSTGAK